MLFPISHNSQCLDGVTLLSDLGGTGVIDSISHRAKARCWGFVGNRSKRAGGLFGRAILRSFFNIYRSLRLQAEVAHDITFGRIRLAREAALRLSQVFAGGHRGLFLR